MSGAMQAFLIFLLGGLLLLGVEIFIPGGILGVLGALSLLGAIVMAFTLFTPATATLVALGIVILLGISLILWIRYFPGTPMGRSLTLGGDGKDFKSSPKTLEELQGRTGVAETSLHPSGIARIDGHRIDVVAESGWIDKGDAVTVVSVAGNHATVRRQEPAEPQQGDSAS